MRYLVIALTMILSSNVKGEVAHNTYVSEISALTLGYPQVEGYQAYLVTTLPPSNIEELRKDLIDLCTEFPRIDKYTLYIFNDPKFANSDTPVDQQSLSDVEKQAYVARYITVTGKLILFPRDRIKRKAVQIGANWCSN